MIRFVWALLALLGGVLPVHAQTTATCYGSTVRAWVTANRPSTPADGTTGYNLTTGYCETWRAAVGVWSSGQSAPVAPYLGQIATKTALSDTLNGGITASMARSAHTVRIAPGTSLATVQVVVGNWYVNTGTETPTGGVKTATCSIEYPVGTFNQCRFSGATSVAIASGGQVISDPIQLATPLTNGAVFYERYYYTNPAGIDFASLVGNFYTELYNFSSATDQTMGGTVADSQFGYDSYLLAIIAPTTVPAVCVVGDSRADGDYDWTLLGNAALTQDVGEVARSIGPSFAYINLGTPGDTAAGFVGGHAKRGTLFQYCSHVVDEYGINDLSNSVAAATLFASQQSIAGLFPGKPFFLTTVAPRTTSTDTFLTTTNQTKFTGDAARVTYNHLVMSSSGIGWLTGSFDTASVVESSRDSGLWQVCNPAIVNCVTYDGLHENYYGYRAIQESGVINTSMIHLPY